MSYEKLDDFIFDLARPTKEIPIGPASVGLLTLKKLAEELPETTGSSEGEFAAPLEQVCGAMQQLVSYKLTKQAAYMVLRPHLDELRCAEYDEKSHAEFLLRRLNALKPEGFEIPPCVPVEGTRDKREAYQRLIAMEQQALIMLRQLCQLVGEANPTCHTLKCFAADDQKHLDRLWVELPKEAPTSKLAARLPKIAALGVHQVPTRSHEFDDDTRKEQRKTAQPVVVPDPAADSPEDYVTREKQLGLEQAARELAHTKMQLTQVSTAAQQAMAEGQQAQEQLAQAQEEAAVATQQAQETQAQAIEAEGRAAEHATQKMQLGMRVQQMRQALAEIATQDPVSETGASVDDLAAQGAPTTPDQMEEQALAEEEAAAAEAPPAKAKDVKEVEEAGRAQDEAAKQTAQATKAVAPAATPAMGAPAATPAGAPLGMAG
jgi:hypothetical protein